MVILCFVEGGLVKLIGYALRPELEEGAEPIDELRCVAVQENEFHALFALGGNGDFVLLIVLELLGINETQQLVRVVEWALEYIRLLVRVN